MTRQLPANRQKFSHSTFSFLRAQSEQLSNSADKEWLFKKSRDSGSPIVSTLGLNELTDNVEFLDIYSLYHRITVDSIYVVP